MRQIAIYDTYLSDTTVSQILNLFTEKAVINKLPDYDNRWLFHTLTGNSIVDMVLAETNIVEDEAGFKVIDAGSYVLTNPYDIVPSPRSLRALTRASCDFLGSSHPAEVSGRSNSSDNGS